MISNDINRVLSTVRPFLQADNGDVEFVEMSEDGIVKVKLTGSCAICPLSIMTLRAGIERAIMREIPGVRRVEAVE
jgi:Fe-S cluster biogenesis protein NfuA